MLLMVVIELNGIVYSDLLLVCSCMVWIDRYLIVFDMLVSVI